MTPYLMPRADWSTALESIGCVYLKDADGMEGRAEMWKSSRGRAFLVPYLIIPDEDERRVADYSLKRIIAQLEHKAPTSGNGAA